MASPVETAQWRRSWLAARRLEPAQGARRQQSSARRAANCASTESGRSCRSRRARSDRSVSSDERGNEASERRVARPDRGSSPPFLHSALANPKSAQGGGAAALLL